MVEKRLLVKFVFTGDNVETATKSIGLSIFEQIGLLENTKRILLEKLKRKEEEFVAFRPEGEK